MDTIEPHVRRRQTLDLLAEGGHISKINNGLGGMVRSLRANGVDDLTIHEAILAYNDNQGGL